MEEELEQQEIILPQPRIFEGDWLQGVPEGFNTILLDLDGRGQAELNWDEVRRQAQSAIEQGFSLLWNMNLGLFNGLTQSLSNQAQFLSLSLSLEHFRDTLWNEFKSHTVGISLYCGSCDFSQAFHWNIHQEVHLAEWLKEMGWEGTYANDDGQQLIRLFCQEVSVEYLLLLAGRVPDTLPVYLFLHVPPLSLVHELQLLNPERFHRFKLVLKNQKLPFDVPPSPDPTIGICVPSSTFFHPRHYRGFEEVLTTLSHKAIPFKMIAENDLTSQWEGLDYLIFSPTGITTQGIRKLQGFCAAGGTAVSTGDLVGLPLEIEFNSQKF